MGSVDSALRTIASLEPADHLCCLYDTEEERSAVAAAFVRRGLEQHEKVVCIGDMVPDQAILAALTAGGMGPDPYLDSGQLTFLNADDTYMAGGRFDPERMVSRLQAELAETLAQGYVALRITGETSWVRRGRPGTRKIIDYEERLNRFSPGSRCMTLCQYDRRHTDPQILLAVLASHPLVMVGDHLYENFYYVPPAGLLGKKRFETVLHQWLQNLATYRQSQVACQRQAQIIDQIHDSVISVDLAGQVTSWNQGAQRLFGYTAQEALGQHISFLYPPDQQKFLQQEVIAPTLRKGNHELEVRLLRQSGAEFQAHLSLSLLRDDAGTTVGMIGYTMDINARKQAEDAVQRHLARLEILHELDRAILEAQSLDAISQAVLAYVRRLIPCLGADVVLFDPGIREGIMLAADVEDQAQLEQTRQLTQSRVPLEVFGDVEDLRRGRVHVVKDLHISSTMDEAIQRLVAAGVRSYINVPLVVRDELVGCLNLGSDRPGAFSPEEVDIARQVAAPLAIAVHQARLLQRLRILSQRLIDVQETERHRIARELHDEIGQLLTAVKINLQILQQSAGAPTLVSQLEESVKLVARALHHVRNLSLDLRPSLLDDLGLVATLRWYVDRQAQSGGFAAQVRAEPPEMDLPRDLATACFRIVQEALTNVVSHAGAQRVQVELRQQDGYLHLVVRDDGVGFDLPEAAERTTQGLSTGLLSMQERVALLGGQFDILSDPGRSTKLQARFPLDAGPAAGDDS